MNRFPRPSRRDSVRVMAAAAGASLFDPGPALAGMIEQTAQSCEDPHALGQLVETLPLSRAGGLVQPFGVKIGGPGLDARSNTDLSGLQADSVDHADRTGLRADGAPAGRPGTPRDHGRSRPPPALVRAADLPLDEVSRTARSMGAHLLECSGNNNPANFGLMSVAQWDGVPLAEVVSTLRPSSGATGVLVSGVDPDQPSKDAPLQARAGCFRWRHSIRWAPFSRFG